MCGYHYYITLVNYINKRTKLSTQTAPANLHVLCYQGLIGDVGSLAKFDVGSTQETRGFCQASAALC